MFKKNVVLFVLMIITQWCFAQQEAMFTHYMYNTLAVNPAYAGSRDALTITALHRSQWIGFPGAPQTQTLTLHAPLFKDAFNFGLSVVNDKIGPINTTGVFLDYAFRVKITPKDKLAFGLKMGLNGYSFDLSQLKAIKSTDNLTSIKENSILPNVGVGIYYYGEMFYVGLSTPKLFENNYNYFAEYSTLSIEKKHFYWIMGGLIPLNRALKLKPGFLVKLTQGAPIEGDATLLFLFNDSYSLGAMFRSGDALGVLLGIAVTEEFTVGYSYDWSFVNTTGLYNAGSHEVILRYDAKPKKRRKYTSMKNFCKF